MWAGRSHRSGSSDGTRSLPPFDFLSHFFTKTPQIRFSAREQKKRGERSDREREGGRGGPLRPPETTFATAAATDDDLCLQSREPSGGVRGGDRRGAQLSTRTRQREASERADLENGMMERRGETNRRRFDRIIVRFSCRTRQTWESIVMAFQSVTDVRVHSLTYGA